MPQPRRWNGPPRPAGRPAHSRGVRSLIPLGRCRRATSPLALSSCAARPARSPGSEAVEGFHGRPQVRPRRAPGRPVRRRCSPRLSRVRASSSGSVQPGGVSVPRRSSRRPGHGRPVARGNGRVWRAARGHRGTPPTPRTGPARAARALACARERPLRRSWPPVR